MRQDMYKIIVERPRKFKENDSEATRRRGDFEGPTRLGIRAGYGYRALNENLAPLERYLHAQVGRPWNKVFGEICAGIDRRNTVQQHIHQHIHDFIATNVEVRVDGELIDLEGRGRFFATDLVSQRLYVDPRTGLIRANKHYRSWKKDYAERRKQEDAAIARRRRVIDDRTLAMLVDGLWFLVGVDTLPPRVAVYKEDDGRRYKSFTSESRFDLLLRRKVRRTEDGDLEECERLYGSSVYAVSKRQLSKREIKEYGLLGAVHRPTV